MIKKLNSLLKKGLDDSTISSVDILVSTGIIDIAVRYDELCLLYQKADDESGILIEYIIPIESGYLSRIIKIIIKNGWTEKYLDFISIHRWIELLRSGEINIDDVEYDLLNDEDLKILLEEYPKCSKYIEESISIRNEIIDDIMRMYLSTILTNKILESHESNIDNESEKIIDDIMIMHLSHILGNELSESRKS